MTILMKMQWDLKKNILNKIEANLRTRRLKKIKSQMEKSQQYILQYISKIII